jgi:hypothetical protein
MLLSLHLEDSCLRYYSPVASQLLDCILLTRRGRAELFLSDIYHNAVALTSTYCDGSGIGIEGTIADAASSGLFKVGTIKEGRDNLLEVLTHDALLCCCDYIIAMFCLTKSA